MNAICSICGRDMTVQDREGTAFCLSCENAGLHARIAELEATATGPERDLAEQTLALLEAALGAEDGFVVRGWQLKDGELTIQRIDGKLHYLWEYPDRIGHVTRADALARLREKGAKDAG